MDQSAVKPEWGSELILLIRPKTINWEVAFYWWLYIEIPIIIIIWTPFIHISGDINQFLHFLLLVYLINGGQQGEFWNLDAKGNHFHFHEKKIRWSQNTLVCSFQEDSGACQNHRCLFHVNEPCYYLALLVQSNNQVLVLNVLSCTLL